MLEVLKIPTRLGHEVHVASSGKESGNMSTTYEPEDMAEIVFANRERFYGRVGLNGAEVIRIWTDDLNRLFDLDADPNPPLTETRGLRCDGLLTTEFGRGLALMPADCVPMVIYAHDRPLLSLVHVGRNNAEAGMHTNSLRYVTQQRGVPINEVGVYLGPSIQKGSYVYEYLDQALEKDKRWQPYIKKQNGVYHLDLFGYVWNDLTAAGLRPEQIASSKVDTGADETYFSHRRSQLTGEPKGRNGIVAVMREK